MHPQAQERSRPSGLTRVIHLVLPATRNSDRSITYLTLFCHYFLDKVWYNRIAVLHYLLTVGPQACFLDWLSSGAAGGTHFPKPKDGNFSRRREKAAPQQGLGDRQSAHSGCSQPEPGIRTAKTGRMNQTSTTIQKTSSTREAHPNDDLEDANRAHISECAFRSSRFQLGSCGSPIRRGRRIIASPSCHRLSLHLAL